METRVYGRTGMEISILGFGCGAVGGLMVRGASADQEKAIGRALDAGINYFDTAVQYGNGASETNLGRAWKTLNPAGAFVGTKVRIPPADFGRIAEAVTESLDGSLARLQIVVFAIVMRLRKKAYIQWVMDAGILNAVAGSGCARLISPVPIGSGQTRERA